jgi:hypothetical protein
LRGDGRVGAGEQQRCPVSATTWGGQSKMKGEKGENKIK